MSEILHVLKAGDTFPSVRVTVTDSLGNAISLSGTTVEFVMVKAGGDVVLSAAATVEDAAAGVVAYHWVDGDTDVPGRYRAEFVVTFANGKTMTAPNGEYIELLIVARLA